MPVVKNRFLDPDTGDTYTWNINQSWTEDENSGVQNSLTFNTTTGFGIVPQYGEGQPQIRTLGGTILHKAQHDAFLVWAALAREHTIYFRDCDSVEYEVFIQRYSWRQQGVAWNPQDANMRLHIYKYTLELVIYGLAP